MTTTPQTPDALASAWASAWSQPEPTLWLPFYSPKAVYTDHAHGFSRTGHASLKIHHTIWRTSIPDFAMTIVERWHQQGTNIDTARYSIRFRATGTNLGDLPARKATGRKFVMHGRVDFEMLRLREGKGWVLGRVDE
ncbi:hypothetical protein M409DRAFT_26568 [Zasmidium cellare ATCC 36951]|uniref:SnoaL-like domain-containing protein n=1 Tax=Zasmidium cellare ATCC 36951 TaxID=1080233 RepID=A0A6A6C8G1_ZASCE|nr:uncharacterized protein M409DRAFT_26568 [Zasmidium cellare ATCC 36951]KAF2163123.1 hypothetical protein M409DRAFT_26568 [Zasmidium cellare ATCC 36951]